MADIKNNVITPPQSVIQLQTLSVNYVCPAFFLDALAGHGIKNLSAAHMGIPTANITDDLLLLKKALDYGKKPQVVVLAINVRDFLVPSNWPAIEFLDEPIRYALGDILSVPAWLCTNRLIRELFIYARPSVLMRYADEQRFFFAYECYRCMQIVPVLKSIFGQSDILRNRMASEFESENHFDAKIAGNANCFKLDPQTQNKIFAFRNNRFEDRQIEAFKQAVSLCKSHGIKLIITQVPLYPGMYAPAAAQRRYDELIASAASKEGVYLVNSRKQNDYSYGHFEDLLHLNGVGGERFFWRLADFIYDHKTELLKQQNFQ